MSAVSPLSILACCFPALNPKSLNPKPLAATKDKDAADESGSTALITAAENGQLDAVQVLLEAGANADAVAGSILETSFYFREDCY